MLRNQSDVRVILGRIQESTNNSCRSQVAAAIYLHQLAEQVRNGAVVNFQVSWVDQGDIEAEITPRK